MNGYASSKETTPPGAGGYPSSHDQQEERGGPPPTTTRTTPHKSGRGSSKKKSKLLRFLRDFAISYRACDDFGGQAYLPLVSDWDLSAAFASASEPGKPNFLYFRHEIMSFMENKSKLGANFRHFCAYSICPICFIIKC